LVAATLDPSGENHAGVRARIAGERERQRGAWFDPRGGAMAQQHTSYRRSWKKWAAIYVAVAAVIYLVVYLMFFTGGGGGSGY
jgi:hypothetical protein